VVTFSGSGTTCIVGPERLREIQRRGCHFLGFGEQSHKSLRADAWLIAFSMDH